MQRIIKHAAFVCIFLDLLSPVFPQATIPAIEKNKLVDIPFTDYAIGEPHLAVDPTNSQALQNQPALQGAVNGPKTKVKVDDNKTKTKTDSTKEKVTPTKTKVKDK